ncbi:biotin transporter BioY [Neisseria perflava]|uniref:biotin transporter BioY n=1 Tax=Neisseria perflava TaxID=33053 RepID=UPI0020A0FCB1|nr:biotin transporter BioY [Neisseria perflava]MCP1659438.1 biotin transport system substrate-specific component [Neisseria perflava]MCP1772278.1 biotin transport system substrate-specific component [Neisseria perflava]
MMNQVNVIRHWADANRTTAFWLKTALGANLIAVLAQFAVPLPFVSITLQSLGVLLIGFALGRKAGVAAVLLYLLEGAAGMPVFANGKAGLAVLMGSSGGYLFGYIFMALILGWASDKGALKSVWKTVAAGLAGTAALYALGLAQLSLFVPADKVLAYGLYPFIAGDIIKAFVAAVLLAPTYRFFQKL